MNRREILFAAAATLAAATWPAASAWAGTIVQIGASGKTFASGAVQCTSDPTWKTFRPTVEAGLFNPKPGTTAAVSLNGAQVGSVTTTNPATTVWLVDGKNSVVVAFGKKVADSFFFDAKTGLCNLPDTSGNTFSPDGTLEYAASGKSYATVTPGCAMSPITGQPQPYVHLFDNGGYLLNVSVNGVPLTQLSAFKTHTPVFLSAGQNVISAANGSLSIDYFIRNGGDGRCVLP